MKPFDLKKALDGVPAYVKGVHIPVRVICHDEQSGFVMYQLDEYEPVVALLDGLAGFLYMKQEDKP